MPAVSPTVRLKLTQQLVRSNRWRDAAFPTFLAEAKSSFPELGEAARFEFICYRIWRAQDELDSVPVDFAEQYKSFEQEFSWSVPGAPAWATQERLLSTLTFWQKRHPIRLKASDGLRILERLQYALTPERTR